MYRDCVSLQLEVSLSQVILKVRNLNGQSCFTWLKDTVCLIWCPAWAQIGKRKKTLPPTFFMSSPDIRPRNDFKTQQKTISPHLFTQLFIMICLKYSIIPLDGSRANIYLFICLFVCLFAYLLTYLLTGKCTPITGYTERWCIYYIDIKVHAYNMNVCMPMNMI